MRLEADTEGLLRDREQQLLAILGRPAEH
jgi:hypothetical protein